MISVEIIQSIHSKLDDNKAIILMGPRQVGKTTLLKYLQNEMNIPSVWWNGDEPDIRQFLESTSTQLKGLIGRLNYL